MASPNVADLLVEIGGVGIRPSEPFTFASGLISPIYCDNRLFLSRPGQRAAMLQQLYALIEQTLGTSWDVVAGVATAGIPWAAWVAVHFDKPMVYIRPAEKDHGKRNRIEGDAPQGSNAIVVEDLVTTGGSALSAVEALREAGLVCQHCVSLFDYGFAAAAHRFEADQVTLTALTNIDGLLDALRRRNVASDQDVEAVKAWHAQVNAQALPASG